MEDNWSGQPTRKHIPFCLLDKEFDLFMLTGEHRMRPVAGETHLLRSSPDTT